jgi:hypothetical protein
LDGETRVIYCSQWRLRLVNKYFVLKAFTDNSCMVKCLWMGHPMLILNHAWSFRIVLFLAWCHWFRIHRLFPVVLPTFRNMVLFRITFVRFASARDHFPCNLRYLIWRCSTDYLLTTLYTAQRTELNHCSWIRYLPANSQLRLSTKNWPEASDNDLFKTWYENIPPPTIKSLYN